VIYGVESFDEIYEVDIGREMMFSTELQGGEDSVQGIDSSFT
jgi:hypothetical protein